MKMIYLLIAVAAIAFTTSCNNDSGANNESKEMKHDETEMKNMKMDSTNIDSTKSHQQMDTMIKK